MNCLACGRYPKPKNDGVDLQQDSGDSQWNVRGGGVDRYWSGDPTPPPYAHMRSTSISANRDKKKQKKKGHRKIASTGSPLLNIREATAEPRLVRSRGMRRDWSFEDLHKPKAKAMKV